MHLLRQRRRGETGDPGQGAVDEAAEHRLLREALRDVRRALPQLLVMGGGERAGMALERLEPQRPERSCVLRAKNSDIELHRILRTSRSVGASVRRFVGDGGSRSWHCSWRLRTGGVTARRRADAGTMACGSWRLDTARQQLSDATRSRCFPRSVARQLDCGDSRGPWLWRLLMPTGDRRIGQGSAARERRGASASSSRARAPISGDDPSHGATLADPAPAGKRPRRVRSAVLHDAV